MKEIKFRAQNSKTKAWNYFSLQDLVGAITPKLGNGFHFYNWCEYSGLKDKNQKEIYEGDLVQVADWQLGFNNRGQFKIREVVFEKGAFTLKGHEDWRLYIYPDPEIIGNVYENPELLKSS